MFRQLVQGLIGLLNFGLIHRDIKLKNILYNPSTKTLKLADFGQTCQLWARVEDNLSNEVGSAGFRAPELLLGSTRYTYKADIWSAGVVLYFLLTGKMPFQKMKRIKVTSDGETIQPEQPKCHSELSVLFNIVEFTGFPQKSCFEDEKKYPQANMKCLHRPSQRQVKETREHFFEGLSADLVDLFEKIFVMEPDKRISMTDLRDHPVVTGLEAGKTLPKKSFFAFN